MYYPVNYSGSMYDSYYGGTFYQHVYPPSFVPYNINPDHITSEVMTKKREEDEKEIENFIQEAEKDVDTSERKNVKGSKIAKTRDALMNAFRLNKKLQNIHEELRTNTNLPETEWQEKMTTCLEIKQQILETLNVFKDAEFMKELQMDIKKRKKKRQREKAKRKNWAVEKSCKMEHRARLNAEADAWLRSKQAEIEKEKQEEELRKDADIILLDVRNKRSDAKKFLSLLQELKNLRNVKANIAKARGENVSTAATEAFNAIIGKLTEQWSALDREYSIEEQGLKLMLKTDNEQRIEKQKKNVFDEWQNVLFGKKFLTDQATMDINSLVMVRTAWDKYICYDNDGSSVPVGWVMPVKPQSAAWQKCLKNDVS